MNSKKLSNIDLGYMYFYGDYDCSINKEKANKFFLKAWQEDYDAEALFYLGLYAEEQGDTNKAEEYYQEAIQFGDGNSMNNQGVLYDKQRNETSALVMFLLANTKAGYINALNIVKNNGATKEVITLLRRKIMEQSEDDDYIATVTNN